MKSGRYEIINDHVKETIRLDIDGDQPLEIVSGTIHNRFKKNTNWIAELNSVDPTTWEGEIWYKEGFTSTFQYTSVKVKTGSRSTLEIEFVAPFRKVVKHYKHVSFKFRSVEFEFDVEKGTQAVTSIDTHAHPIRPLKLPKEQLTIANVFERVGYDVSLNPSKSTIPTTASGADARWSDSEMHDAMKRFWSRYKDKSQWAMWVFFGKLHEQGTGLGGIMFDEFGKAHRQGTAIFNDSFINDPRSGDPNSNAWVERMKFWTACHEIGHGFNLAHSWQKSIGDSWIPLRNESSALSFMNYPARLGEERFFHSFEYEFSASELTFMRHAPEQFVQMGNADWFDEHGFVNLETADSSLNLELSTGPDDCEFEFLEPVMIEACLTNHGQEPKLIPGNALIDGHHTTVIVKKDGSESQQFANYAQKCWNLPKAVLHPMNSGQGNEEIREAIFISASKQGWIISDPGYYTIQAALHLGDGEDVVSNELRIRVLPPTDKYEEERIAQDFFSDDVGRIIALDGSQYLETGNNCLKTVVAKLPQSNAAYHAQLALTMPLTRSFKSIDPETKKTTVSKPDYVEAAKSLEQVLNADQVKSKKTIGQSDHLFYSNILNDVKTQTT